jgi:hypothetical protein
MSSPVKMQTVGEATNSITNVFQSTFSSLASSLKLPQLRDSFYQNIIYIFIAIIILVGILVYIQMVGTTHTNPLNLPASKEIKKIEIQKIVEGFDMEQNGGIEEFAENIGDVGDIGVDGGGGLYGTEYNPHNELAELTTDVFHNDEPNNNNRRKR